MRRLRMGVIGCGEIAQIMHLPYLTELSELFEVRAACDLSPGLVDSVADAFHVPHRYTEYAGLLSRDDIDAVAVLTLDHAPAVLAAVEAGKHVLVEKPMCFTLDEGRAMIAAAERHGVTLMVGYMKRYDPGYEYAQRAIAEMPGVRLIRIHDMTGRGPLAPRDIYSLRHAGDVPPEQRSEQLASIDARLAQAIGSQQPSLMQAYSLLLGLSSHDMTILRGAFGDPLAVQYAEVSSGGAVILAILEYPEQVRCVLELGNVPEATRSWFDEELTVYGSAHTLAIRFPNPYVRYAPTTVHVQEMDGTAHVERTVTASYDEAFRREWRHFHHCVVSGDQPRTTAADGLRDVEILSAIVRCAAQGRPVELRAV